MKTSLAFITVLISLIGFGQDTTFIITQDTYNDTVLVDTVVYESPFEKHILLGTTKLSWTHNQMDARSYGLNFIKVEKSDCMSSGEQAYKMKNKINYIDTSEMYLIVDINISDNCCYDFLCDISVDEKGILNLIYHGYGDYCACDCCFGLKYVMEKMNYNEIKDITGIIINNDSTTFKPIN